MVNVDVGLIDYVKRAVSRCAIVAVDAMSANGLVSRECGQVTLTCRHVPVYESKGQGECKSLHRVPSRIFIFL